MSFGADSYVTCAALQAGKLCAFAKEGIMTKQIDMDNSAKIFIGLSAARLSFKQYLRFCGNRAGNPSLPLATK